MDREPVSGGRRAFAIVIFVALAGLCLLVAALEGGTYPFGWAAVFLWLAVFAANTRGRNATRDTLVETAGGLVLLVAGVLTLLERDEVREMAASGRDRSGLLIYVVAPLFTIGGLVYAIRGLIRLGRGKRAR